MPRDPSQSPSQEAASGPASKSTAEPASEPAAEAPAYTAGWDDRAAELRADPAILDRPDALVLPFWRGRPLIAGDTATGLVAGWLSPDNPVLRHPGAGRVFLGLHDGHPRLAADISSWEPDAPGRSADAAALFDRQEYRHKALPADHRFADLRGLLTGMNAADAAMAASARALFNWHRTHGFCAACGARSDMALAGWERHCPACGARHFPRTDPVVIMLVLHGDRALLGRQAAWPEGMYSLLAGFMEPGETIEEAVRRETLEEAGVPVGRVGYLCSQPWPFPCSLMIGCIGEALSQTIARDDLELEDAIWAPREEVAAALRGAPARFKAGRQGAVARLMLEAWVSGEIGATW